MKHSATKLNSCMKQRIRISSIIGVLVFYIATPLWADAKKEMLDFSVSCVKTDWVIAEPVIVHVTIKNTSTTEQLIPKTISLASCVANYLVSNDNVEFSQIWPILLHDPPRSRIALPPGSSFYHEEMLLYSSKLGGLAFPKSGSYFIKVKCLDRTSNAIKINVISPWSIFEFVRSKQLADKDVLKTLINPLIHTDKSLSVLQKYAYSHSIYAPYAAFALLCIENDAVSASKLFKIIDASECDLRSQAVGQMANFYLSHGNETEGTILLKRLESEFPRSSAACAIRFKNAPTLRPPEIAPSHMP